MDNKEFDHLMGDKLRREQSFDFWEPDWTDLSQQLDDHDRKKRVIPFWFWRSMLAIAVLGTIIFLWNELEKTKRTVQELESNSIENNLTITDTIYKKVMITEYDTIRKIIVVEEVEKRNLSFEKMSAKPEKEISNIFIKEKREDSSVIISEGKEKCNCEEDELKRLVKPLNFTTIESTIDVESSETIKATKELNLYKNIEVQSQSIDLCEAKNRELSLTKYQDLPLTIIQKFPRRKPFSIGLLGAWHLTEKQSIPGYNPDGFFNLYSKGLGLRTEFMITNNISLTGDVIYQKINFKTNDSSFVQDILIAEEIPTGLDTLNVDQSNLNYALGVKYFVRKRQKIQLYTSIKLQAVSRVEQKGSGLLPGGPYLEPTLYESTEKNTAIELQSVETALGFQYRLLRYLSWQAEGNYHFHVDRKEVQLRSKIGLKTSLLFHF